MQQLWNGYIAESFTFEHMQAVFVRPKVEPCGHWCLKCEYWGAYPAVELALLEKGFCLAWVQNTSRFAPDEDCHRKARFAAHIASAYGLLPRCVPVGMSCGGAHAVRFAGLHPECVEALYIDAPVLNYASLPGKLGVPFCEEIWDKEFTVTYPGITRSDLLCFDGHPVLMAGRLIEARIPTVMVWGEEDATVDYNENGRLLEQAMEGSGLLRTIAVPCRGHHPHGMLGSQRPIVDFILQACGM